MVKFNKNLLKKLRNLSIVKSIEKDRVLYLYTTGIALFFWIFLKLSKSYESNIDVKLDYNIEDQHAFLYSPPDYVNVTLAAKGWDLLSLNTISRSSLTIDVYNRQRSVITAEELQSRISTIIGSDKSLKSLFLEKYHIIFKKQSNTMKVNPKYVEDNLVYTSIKFNCFPTWGLLVYIVRLDSNIWARLGCRCLCPLTCYPCPSVLMTWRAQCGQCVSARSSARS